MKQWVRVSRAANSLVVVTVTVQDGPVSTKWSTRVGRNEIKAGVMESRRYAIEALQDAQAAVEYIEEEEAA